MRAVPEGWSFRRFEVRGGDGAVVGSVDLSNWRESAEIEVGGGRYRAVHGALRKDFVLSREDGGVVLAVEKPSAFRDRFYFEHDGHYELRKESAWGRAFELRRDGTGAVGSLRPEGMFRRSWTAELPDDLSPEVCVFLIWLAILLDRRAAAGGAAAVSAGF